MLSVRPKIAELVYQFYGRSLHPELFDIQQSRRVSRGDYAATIHITNSGHVVTWTYQGLVLTETAAAANQPLPQRRRLMAYRLQGTRSDAIDCRGGVRFEMSYSLEPADREKFAAYDQQLTLPATRDGMLQRFEASGRFERGALSYIAVDCRDKAMRIQAFHTFPDDAAVLKIQSVYRVPK
ncbi:MAG: DUF2617 family protein [Pirellulales bacterium]|nr:DUF2617 family protein [Pirellulales bacterium]